MPYIDLTRDQCESVANLIEDNLFEIIRNDLDADNMNWLCNICAAYTELKLVVDNG